MDKTRIVSIYCAQDPDNEGNVLFEVVNESKDTEWENEANFIIRSYGAVLLKLSEKSNGMIQEVNIDE